MKKLIFFAALIMSLSACRDDKKTTGEDPRVEGTEFDSTGVEAPDGDPKNAQTNIEKSNMADAMKARVFNY